MTDPNVPIQQPVAPAPQPVQAASASKSTSVCAIIATVFGALAFVTSFIPIINNGSFILGLIGVVLGIIAMVGTLRGKKEGKAIAIIGTVLSVLAIVITLVMQSAASKAIDNAVKETKGVDSSQTTNKGTQDLEGDIEGAHVKIVSAVKAGTDYNGKDTVLVTYEWKNTTSKNNSFAVIASTNVFQNGTELDTAIYTDAPEGYDSGSDFAQVQPDATGKVTIAYVLQDDSPVDVEVTPSFSVSDNSKVSHTFNLQ